MNEVEEILSSGAKDAEQKRQDLENKLQSLNDALTVSNEKLGQVSHRQSLLLQRSMTHNYGKNNMSKQKSHVKFKIDQMNDSICVKENEASRMSKV